MTSSFQPPMPGSAPPASPDELVDVLERDGIEFIFAMFVDLHGKPCAKLVPSSAVDQLMTDGAGFAGYAAGAMGQRPSSPDLIAVPDISSYMAAPWQPGLAIIQCDPTVEGELWPYAPRVILRRQLELLDNAGLALKVGAEVEYFLVRREADGSISVADALDVADAPCYDARALTRMYGHLTSVSRHMNALGWSNYANDHEDANGQFEQNFQYADPFTTADRVIVFRYMVHSLASQAGMLATFMPKPFTNLTGNGLHMHLSLWDRDDRSLFDDDTDVRGLGMSAVGYQFVAGLLDHAQALTAVTCPTVNSYKRLAAPAPNSGAAWSPVFATYGGNDRTHMLRIPDAGRVENRLIDGSANPYLAVAAQIAAGMDGVDRSLDPGGPSELDLLRLTPEEIAEHGLTAMPPTLLHALDHLEADPVLRTGLGKTSEGDYVDYFVATKRAECDAAHAQVTPWEIDRYLSAI
ncbi:MAG TPA: type III glutamate--ammonia ligase [Acidimicrobiales bacterium]|nr:type III glutamate--ammonia ligase [Acidimicrobiales bacterium]